MILNQNAKTKGRRNWVPFKVQTSEATKTVHEGGAAYGSVRNLVKTSTLPVSKQRQFLHFEPSYKKFTLATRKFERIKGFALIRNETWCIDLANVEKLAEVINGLKYLLVRQKLFRRTVGAKNWKQKIPKKRFVICDYDYKKKRPTKNWVDKATKIAGEFNKLCKAEGVQISFPMSTTKAAFTEITARSLKFILFYVEAHGYKYGHRLSHFVTNLNSRKKCWIDLIPKVVKNSEL